MLISREAQVRWNGLTRKWYEDRGYQWTRQNEYFNCKIEDIMKTSTVKVLVECDYCGEIFEKEYRYLFKQRQKFPKDCCKKCKNKKQEDVMLKKYNVKNCMQLEVSKKRASETLRTPFQDVYDICKNKNITVLTKKDKYKNENSKLEIICNNHKECGVQKTNFANIKKNKGCCWYGRKDLIADKKRLDGDYVYSKFIEKGLVPKFNPMDYKNNSKPLPFICEQHREKGIQFRSYTNLLNADGCLYCSYEKKAKNLRHEQSFVFNEMTKRGLVPLDSEVYKNKETPIKYRCKKHPDIIQKIRFGCLSTIKEPCYLCRIENNISNLNRYFRNCLGFWKNNVEDSCGYECVLTGSSNYDVHHLYSYNTIIKDGLKHLDLKPHNELSDYKNSEICKLREYITSEHTTDMGVCLNRELHKLYHRLYGSENTKKEYHLFVNRIYDGEFDGFLKNNNLMIRSRKG